MNSNITAYERKSSNVVSSYPLSSGQDHNGKPKTTDRRKMYQLLFFSVFRSLIGFLRSVPLLGLAVHELERCGDIRLCKSLRFMEKLFDFFGKIALQSNEYMLKEAVHKIRTY